MIFYIVSLSLRLKTVPLAQAPEPAFRKPAGLWWDAHGCCERGSLLAHVFVRHVRPFGGLVLTARDQSMLQLRLLYAQSCRQQSCQNRESLSTSAPS